MTVGIQIQRWALKPTFEGCYNGARGKIKTKTKQRISVGRRKKPWERFLCNQNQNQNPVHGKKITVTAAATFPVARKMPIAIAKCVWPASMPPSIS